MCFPPSTYSSVVFPAPAASHALVQLARTPAMCFPPSTFSSVVFPAPGTLHALI